MYSLENLRNLVLTHDKKLIVTFNQPESLKIQRDIGVYLGEQQESHRHYAGRRNAYNPGGNNFTGKAGEFVLHRWLYLLNIGFPYDDCLPDLNTYPRGEKSWKPDLIYSEKYPGLPDFHCKTCDKDTRKFMRDTYNPGNLPRFDEEASWTFSYRNSSDDRGRDPLLDQPDNPVMFGFVYLINTEPISGYVRVTSPWNLISSCPDLPCLFKHRDTKRCIYLRKLQELANEQHRQIP